MGSGLEFERLTRIQRVLNTQPWIQSPLVCGPSQGGRAVLLAAFDFGLSQSLDMMHMQPSGSPAGGSHLHFHQSGPATRYLA